MPRIWTLLRKFEQPFHQGLLRRVLRMAGAHKTILPLVRLIRNRAFDIEWKARFSADPEVTHEINGVQVRFTTHDFRTFHRLSALNTERETIERVVSKLQDDDVFFDVGANVGMWSVIVGKTLGEHGAVVAFEPELDAYTQCVENVALNNLSNVHCLNIALSNYTGNSTLYVRAGKDTHSLDPRRLPLQKAPTDAHQVEVATADDLVHMEKVASPTVVKVDVEGSEFEVLEGLSEALRNSQCRLLICDVHQSVFEPNGKTVPELFELLQKLGFHRFEEVRDNKASGVLDTIIAWK